MPTAQMEALYCYYNSDKQTFTFDSNQDDLTSILANTFVTDTPWSEIDTDDLDFWLERYEDEDHEVPCFSLERGAL